MSRKMSRSEPTVKRAERSTARLAVEEGVAASCARILQESSVYLTNIRLTPEEQLKELKRASGDAPERSCTDAGKAGVRGKVDEMSIEAVNAFWEGLLRIYQVAKEEVPESPLRTAKEFFSHRTAHEDR